MRKITSRNLTDVQAHNLERYLINAGIFIIRSNRYWFWILSGADVDKDGKVLWNKHKGGKGREISVKDCSKIK